MVKSLVIWVYNQWVHEMLRYFIVFFLLIVPASAQTREQVLVVQQALYDEGYDVGTMDGKYGRKTAAAIRLYQSDWQLPETGKINDQLMARLKGEHPDTKPRRLKADNSDCFIDNPFPQPRESVVFIGICENGNRTGKGKTIWRFMNNGKMRQQVHEGEYHDGKEHGQGVLVWSNGGRYEGEFRNGKRHGYGMRITSRGHHYEGEFLNNKPHGQGVYTWTNGNRYEGEFQNDMLHGRAVYTNADGDRFEGEYRNDKRHGKGVYVWKNGNRYEGEYRDGKRHGHGALTLVNGNRYEGEFRDGKKQGQGVFTWPNGTRYEGGYQDDKPHGQGAFTNSDGKIASGIWNNGCLKVGSRGYATGTTVGTCSFK